MFPLNTEIYDPATDTFAPTGSMAVGRTLHTATLSRVTEDVNVGAGIVAKAHQAGEAALRERGRRRKSVLIPLIAIVALLVSLGAYLREIERGQLTTTGAKR